MFNHKLQYQSNENFDLGMILDEKPGDHQSYYGTVTSLSSPFSLGFLAQEPMGGTGEDVKETTYTCVV